MIYIQGAVKPVGMVEGLDSTFDAAIFLGYHARAGTPNGFLAHAGTGSVKGLWLNGVESGEGDLNAAYAGALGVPVILVAGDSSRAARSASPRLFASDFSSRTSPFHISWKRFQLSNGSTGIRSNSRRRT